MYVSSNSLDAADASGPQAGFSPSGSAQEPVDHSDHTDVSHVLEHCPQVVAAARNAVRELMHSWKIGDPDTVVLVVSELVTNAVEHACPPLTLRLHRDRAATGIWVGVTDGGPACEEGAWTSSCTEEEHGRGLGIVEALAESHGWYRHTDGATTHWARLSAAS
ncbi:ATP-binding protein [Streptomyces sp. NPDC047981]|uniref:ATP-binding protein n=1 Tax=Streptomyces sp. NPDC047981 TaxID=3154610 RepID=UPI003424964F